MERSMKFDRKIHHRRSIRLHRYDYTQPGAYFVTMVSYRRSPFFGKVVDGSMQLNKLGEIARREWFRTAELRPYVELFEDEFVVMPNHVHGILWIREDASVAAREEFGKPVTGSIPTIVRAYKSAVTHAVNDLENMHGAILWQRNYYE